MTEDFADCGLNGKDDAPVKTGAFNRMLRRIGVVHLLPMKTAAESMQAHVEECARLQAQIAGGIRVLIWLTGVCTAIGTGVLVFIITHKYMS